MGHLLHARYDAGRYPFLLSLKARGEPEAHLTEEAEASVHQWATHTPGCCFLFGVHWLGFGFSAVPCILWSFIQQNCKIISPLSIKFATQLQS